MQAKHLITYEHNVKIRVHVDDFQKGCFGNLEFLCQRDWRWRQDLLSRYDFRHVVVKSADSVGHRRASRLVCACAVPERRNRGLRWEALASKLPLSWLTVGLWASTEPRRAEFLQLASVGMVPPLCSSVIGRRCHTRGPGVSERCEMLPERVPPRLSHHDARLSSCPDPPQRRTHKQIH